MKDNFLPLCPSAELNALEAAKQLHKEMQGFAEGEGSKREDVVFWDREIAKKMGHVYGKESNPIAQIAWLNGYENWPIHLCNGRSYSAKVFIYEGKRFYIEPADKFVLSFELLDK